MARGVQTMRTVRSNDGRAADSIPKALRRTLQGQFHDVHAQTLAAELTKFLGR
jgi:hypothetical protein